MTLLLTLWREILIGALILATASLWHLYDAERLAHIKSLAAWEAQTAIADSARIDAQQRSDAALTKLRTEHETNLAKIEKNAWRNFAARYGELCPVRLQPQPAAALPQRGDAADNTVTPDDAADQRMAFVSGCARDAATVSEWQMWARANRLPVEGE